MSTLINYEYLRLIWWLFLGVLLIGFAIMDGFDLGVATLLPFVARDDVERRMTINTIGPVWDGNQVWLLLGGGAIFAAWPPIYATAFSGFYIAIFLVLLTLILRPVGFEFRNKIADPGWRAVCAGGDSPNRVFLAVRDAIERFAIPLRLLDELAAGVTMDLKSGSPDSAVNDETGCPILSVCRGEPRRPERVGSQPPDTYATFADLYRYCYLVASVVGLVCIRIFGYKDSRAEKLAEETGIAFQLTNILRDVAEDAARNRVYLPLEDMATHSVSLDSLLHRVAGAPPTASERALLAEIAARAEKFYESAQALMPLIDRESRPALWVLVAIYHGLLKRIERADYDVFSRRVGVPMAEKLGILAVGLAGMAWARMAE